MELVKQQAPVVAANKHRMRVLQEILETETVYVERLGDCVRAFIVPLRMKYAQQPGWFTSHQWETLNDELKEMESIYHINLEFKDQLTKAMASGRVADVFTDAIKVFRSYSCYINGYDDALAVIAAAKKANPALDAFLKVRTHTHTHTQNTEHTHAHSCTLHTSVS